MFAYRLIHALLDDANGMSSEVYHALINWLTNHENGSPEMAKKISEKASVIDGRWHVPDGTLYKPKERKTHELA